MLSLLAALIFFTRLPFWRITEVPSGYFKRVVPWWPVTGWLTAGITVAILYGFSLILPYQVALLIAIISRTILTGALHEDGLADFIDGFGGGTSRERILTIMKDSHIGTYGVIGLIFYFGTFYTLLSVLPITIAGSLILTADPLSKSIAAMTINRLPYSRNEETAKNRTVYSRMTNREWMVCGLSGLIPLLCLPGTAYIWAILFPVFTWLLLTTFIERKIQGYTGDCCGAIFLLCELSFYLGAVIIYETL